MAFFRLKAGLHIQADHTKEPSVVLDSRGNEVKRWPSKTFKEGQIVPANNDEEGEPLDLVARHGAAKFERVSDDMALAVQKDLDARAARRVARLNDQKSETEEAEDEAADSQLDTMTKAQLIKFADDNNIDLGGATSKHDILAAIRQRS